MITCIIGDRQSGKTTFAIEDILGFYKEKKFVFFSHNNELSFKKFCMYLQKNKNANIKNFKAFTENCLIGLNLDFAIFDDYETFKPKARLALLNHPHPKNFDWFILCSGNDPYYTESFYDTIKAVRNITTNSGLSDGERDKLVRGLTTRQKEFLNDVVALPTTEVIYMNDIKSVKKTFMKKWVAKQRIKMFEEN